MTRVKYEILKCNFSFSWACINEHRFTIHKPYLCYPESTSTYYKRSGGLAIMQLNQMRMLTLKLTLRFEFSVNLINAFRIFILLSGQVYGR